MSEETTPQVPRPLWWATLVRTSDRYPQWRQILGSEDVPLFGPRSSMALFDRSPVEVYALDIKRLTPEQRQRLVAFIAIKFATPVDEVERDLNGEGFPIRAEDVQVAFSLRAFI